MQIEIEKIKKELDEEITKVENTSESENLKNEYLGKKGKITALMMQMKDVPNELKKQVGMQINALRAYAEENLNNLAREIAEKELQKAIEQSDKYDISRPSKEKIGSLHPITIVQKEVEDIFVSMGFIVEDGAEIETEYNNFEAVNVPKNHPARDMQDTFWLDNGQVLKTQTSASQNKILRKYGAPCRVIFPGRCYRNEDIDASHDATFYQVEGMVVGEDVNIANLIYFMKTMISMVLKKDLQVRMRPGFFPFVEPGFELDISCPFCDGKGCPTCKHGGWIELCPCGMIHPKVLEMGGVDSEKYRGFAFGLGLSRLAMMRYKLDNIRTLSGNKLPELETIGIK